MSVEAVILAVYLLGCIAIGFVASRRVLSSNDDYWVAGRSVGPWMNAIAIMATLASGGSIVGVMGYAYSLGIPATLALYAGAVVGFPLASLLVARPLRRFGKYTITDFLAWRYDHPIVRWGVPSLIVVSFTAYIIAQLKAAGVTAEVLLGVDYDVALVVSTLVFIAYVSFGGMLAITWTDVLQGTLMLVLVLGVAGLVLAQDGEPSTLLTRATEVSPTLGTPGVFGTSSLVGSFVLWATAIPVVPHVVMRVFSAKDAAGARFSLNLAMVAYSVIVLAAVFVIVPIGVLDFPSLTDADQVFHYVIEGRLPPVVRGIAVAAVIAAVMSTTDALLLACGSAVAHDIVERWVARSGRPPLSAKALGRLNLGVVWVIGLTAMLFALNPPALITAFYSAAIGLLSSALFVPLMAGLWWRPASRLGGALGVAFGALTYLALELGGPAFAPKFTPVLFALPMSLLGVVIGSGWSGPPSDETVAALEALHAPEETA
jgi:sodium/pantothenate symporter